MSRRSDVIASYSRDNSVENSDYSDFEDTKSVKSHASKSKSPQKQRENPNSLTKERNSYVMVNGKAQLSQKYIMDFMIPYTKKQGRNGSKSP